MTEIDFTAFLIAGALGVFFDTKFAFGVIAIWALLKLLKVL